MLEKLSNFCRASLVLALEAEFQNLMTEIEIREEVRGLTALPSPALDCSSVSVSGSLELLVNAIGVHIGIGHQMASTMEF